MRHRLRWLLACSLLATAVAGCSSGLKSPQSSSPQLFVNPDNPLIGIATAWNQDGEQANASALRTVATAPSAVWAAGQQGDILTIKDYSAAATRADRIGLVVVYNIPHRDACGRYSAEAVITNRNYEAWIDQIAVAIGSSRDIVVVEPDGLPDIVRGCLTQRQEAARYQLLRYAMRTLGRLPNAKVYLDAGNPGMFANPTLLVAPLIKAGIYFGKGFSVNVSNFQQTNMSVEWAQWLESKLGHHMLAVIDTSRNGNGPDVATTALSGPAWCNPPGRALGMRPTLDTGQPGIAAYLWIKDPGVSDGPCNGGPAAGQLWPQYALGLARGDSP